MVSNNYLRIIGMAYFFIAVLDILHTLSYEGMILFSPNHYYANQTWIATRFFEAIVMSCGFYFVSKKEGKPVSEKLLIPIYSIVTIIIIFAVFYWHIFPECYIAGIGQTKFKIYSEYVVSFIFILNLLFLINKRRYFTDKVYGYLKLSFIFYAATELAFTIYISNYGFSNLIGHYFKLFAIYYSYRALVETSIKEPYSTIFNDLNKKNGYLEELNRTKDRLFSIIGHDLRSPIAGIGSLLDLASMETEENNYSRIKEYTSLMKKSAGMTIDLLDNLLNWSRSQNNSLQVKKELFLINQLIEDNLAFFNNVSKQKNIEIIFNSGKEAGMLVIADKIMITTVLRNLINNAIKFTPRNGRITIGTRYTGEDVEISVSDTGVGIKEEDQTRLFNFTTNTSTYGTEGEKGTGLGLVLCRDFVEKNDGTIWVESLYGKGTTFYFTVKFGGLVTEGIQDDGSAKSADSIGLIQNTPITSDSMEYKPKILVADDDLINGKIIKKFFDKQGFLYDIAVNGDEALALYNRNDYDIIFMDCMMPSKDGYEVTSRIRSIEGHKKHTNIIAMTASAMDGDRERCLESGMDDYMSKPIDFKVILEMIDKYGSLKVPVVNSSNTPAV
jgi:signal transduction histidine kinase/ActR/RegA family two-component response regulator